VTVFKVAIIAALASLATAAGARADVRMTIRDGHVRLVAKDATPREILKEWARVGGIQIPNVDRIPGAPMTIELTDVPESEMLEVVLRSASGYVAVPRGTDAPNLSRFERLFVMTTGVAPRPAMLSANAPAPKAEPIALEPPPVDDFKERADDNSRLDAALGAAPPGGNDRLAGTSRQPSTSPLGTRVPGMAVPGAPPALPFPSTPPPIIQSQPDAQPGPDQIKKPRGQ
jgi:hypothetical protein